MDAPDDDLVHRYFGITQELQIADAPSIRWATSRETYGFDGAHNYKTSEIKIAEKLKDYPTEYVNAVIVHELAHFLVTGAGYR